MNWKINLQLRDLDLELNQLEAICTTCQHIHYINIAQILKANPQMQFSYIDELERDMMCHAKFCHGKYRIALVYRHQTSAFIGGLA